MEPVALFELLVYKWFRKIAKLAGVDLFQDDYKPTAYTYLLIFDLSLFWLFSVYTMYSYEFEDKIICASMFSFTSEGLIKYYGCIKNSKSIRTHVTFLFEVFQANTKESANKTCLKNIINWVVIIFKYGLTLLIVTAISAILMPFVSYYLVGELGPIWPTYIPGVDENEFFGYTILTLHHLTLDFIFVVGTAGVDLSFMCLVMISYALSDLFRNSVEDFNKKVKRIDTNKMEIKALLKNLVLMHTDLNKVMHEVKINFYEICLIQILMANGAMCVLVYVIMKMNWFSSYFVMAVAFFQVFEYSLLGTIIEIMNDRIYNAICDINLQNLTVTDQRTVLLMTLMAQYPHNLTLGGTKELNVTTFLSSMKTTYTIAMLLLNTE